MSEILYSPDKPKDCKYCYWYYKRKGCTYGDHCYYEVKPKEKESPLSLVMRIVSDEGKHGIPIASI